MKAFTGNLDVDLKIIQELEDHEISKVCRVNKYVASLCDNENFWMNRLINKSLKNLKYIKGDFKYKQLYQYLYFNKTKGREEAIKHDNLGLYFILRKWGGMTRDELILAAQMGSIDILNFDLLHYADVEVTFSTVDMIFPFANQRTIDWLNKMRLVSYRRMIFSLMNESGSYDQIKEYLPQVEDFSDFYFELKDSFEDIESRKKIFELFLENEIDDQPEYALMCNDYFLDPILIQEWNEFVKKKISEFTKKYD